MNEVNRRGGGQRGCSHGCKYCYAASSNKYLENKDFESQSGMLYLTGGSKKRYLKFIKEIYPDYYQSYCKLYPKGGADKKYKSVIHGFLEKMRIKYHVNNSYSKFLPKN